MKPRQPIPRVSKKRLAANGGKTPFLKRSAIRKQRKPIRKVNPKAKAKRKIAYRKMLASPEYKAARKEAMARAGGQCERDWASRPHDPIPIYIRCPQTEELHAHHLRYPKTRPLRASDLLILCKPHHEIAEASKPYKSRMF